MAALRRLRRALCAWAASLAVFLLAACPALAYEQVESIVDWGHGRIAPQYLVVHETANPGASAWNHVQYWGNNSGSIEMTHYVMELDGSTVYHTQPDDTLAWHVGNGNAYTVGIELAHATDWGDFNSQFDEAAKWCADYLRSRGWGVDRMLTHQECGWIWGGTDHTDPNGYFNQYGQSWASFEDRVQSYLTGGSQGGSASGGGSQPGWPSSDGPTVGVHYALHVRGGGWWPEVTDWNNVNDDGYAGAPNTAHDMLIAWADEGTLRYQVHTIEGGWHDWVQAANYQDSVNGMAGVWGQTIDGVRMYYVTPEGREYSQAWYRSQTAYRWGYLETVCDDGTTWGGDDYAGVYGEPLDRLQVCISDGDVYANAA